MDGQKQTSVKDPAGAQHPDCIEGSLPSVYKETYLLAQPSKTRLNTEQRCCLHAVRTGERRTQRRNPFKLPADNFILLRNLENEQGKLEGQHTLKVDEKWSSAAMRWDLREEQDENHQASSRKALSSFGDDPPWRKPGITGSTDRDNIHDYITKRREMFLIEYSLAVKRERIQKLSQVATTEDEWLRRAERSLERNATMFDDILKENNKTSVQTVKTAEQETKAKLEKIAEIKAISGKIVAVKSDIAKNEELLKECIFCHDFLLKLSPPEWQERQEARKSVVDKIKASIQQRGSLLAEPVKPSRRRVSMCRELPPLCDPRTPRRQSVTGPRETVKQKEPSVPVDESQLCEYEEPEVYFTDPQQLLDLLLDLEMQNLTLIQHCRESEENMEQLNHNMENLRRRMEQETEQLTQQTDIIQHAIQREKDRVTELELKARLFSYGEYKSEDQEAMLGALGRKVAEVYRCCAGEGGAQLTTLQALANIEGFVEELLEKVELVPRDLILVATRAQEKEKRLRQREEMVREQKIKQEKRLLKTLERTHAGVKRPAGKRLMPRSLPQVRKQLVNHDEDHHDQETEKHLYFFT